MTGYELHDLLSSNRELISNTWQFFLSVHLALFGVIFIASSRILFRERVVLTGAYLGFMYMNFRAQIDNYAANDRLLKAINDMAPSAPGAATAKFLAVGDPYWIVSYLPMVFGAAALASSLIILFINGKHWPRGADGA